MDPQQHNRQYHTLGQTFTLYSRVCSMVVTAVHIHTIHMHVYVFTCFSPIGFVSWQRPSWLKYPTNPLSATSFAQTFPSKWLHYLTYVATSFYNITHAHIRIVPSCLLHLINLLPLCIKDLWNICEIAKATCHTAQVVSTVHTCIRIMLMTTLKLYGGNFNRYICNFVLHKHYTTYSQNYYFCTLCIVPMFQLVWVCRKTH